MFIARLGRGLRRGNSSLRSRRSAGRQDGCLNVGTRRLETPTVIRDEHVGNGTAGAPGAVGGPTSGEAPVDGVGGSRIVGDVERTVLCVLPQVETVPVIALPLPAIGRMTAGSGQRIRSR